MQRQSEWLALYLIYGGCCVTLLHRKSNYEKRDCMNSDKLRAGIYVMAAVYMIYTAMQLFNEGGNMPAVVFFAVAAAGLIVFAFVIAKRVTDEEKKRAEEKKGETEAENE